MIWILTPRAGLAMSLTPLAFLTPLVRKITIVFVRCHTPKPTFSLSAFPSRRPRHLKTSRRNGCLRSIITALACLASLSVRKLISVMTPQLLTSFPGSGWDPSRLRMVNGWPRSLAPSSTLNVLPSHKRDSKTSLMRPLLRPLNLPLSKRAKSVLSYNDFLKLVFLFPSFFWLIFFISFFFDSLVLCVFIYLYIYISFSFFLLLLLLFPIPVLSSCGTDQLVSAGESERRPPKKRVNLPCAM